MRTEVKTLPGGRLEVGVILETPDDHRSIILDCATCRCLFAYGPATEVAQVAKARRGVAPEHGEALRMPYCPRCAGMANVEGEQMLGSFENARISLKSG